MEREDPASGSERHRRLTGIPPPAAITPGPTSGGWAHIWRLARRRGVPHTAPSEGRETGLCFAEAEAGALDPTGGEMGAQESRSLE